MTRNLLSKSIRAKLIVLLLTITIIPIVILGVVVVRGGTQAIEHNIKNNLEVLGNIKKQGIISYFELRFENLDYIAKQEKTVQVYDQLEKAYGKDNYETYIPDAQHYFDNFLNIYGFKNVYLFSGENGSLLYSHRTGDFSDKDVDNIAMNKLLSRINKTGKCSMSDYSINNTSGEIQSFIGTPIIGNRDGVRGILIIEVYPEEISKIIADKNEFDKDCNIFLVGEDLLIRSNSGNDTDNLKRKINTKSVKLALNGNTGTHFIDNADGISVFSSYRMLDFSNYFETDFNWAIITEVSKDEAYDDAYIIENNIIMLTLVIAILVVLVAFIISKLFTTPIIKLTKIVGIIADGNLSYDIEIDRKDELGELAESMKTMQKNLKHQFESITEGVNVLFSSSSEIMSTMSQLSSGASETATSVSETTSTIEEVKQTVDVSNQKATEIADFSHSITQVSNDGTHSIYETIEGMNKIKEQMGSIADIVIQLSEKSRTIGEIADSVGDLAEQSNLLAVNASIEAAKAGEQGKGFTVVAQEIKNLADRSKQSTVQIRKILFDIQKEISSAVMATEQGGKVIDEGLELSSKANEVINTLASNIEQASQASIQIAASSQQQLIGMDQITSAMENIKEASAQTANSTRQTEESVSELNKLGENLLKILKQYKLN